MILTAGQMNNLLQPYLAVPWAEAAIETQPATPISDTVLQQLELLLDLLLKWNARTNLTSIRDPEQIVQRHFGESIFLARAARHHLHADATVIDFGSGAGFPGIPLQILYPELRVTLAESQGKKVAFLHEAVRGLNLRAEVWGQRVEAMPSSKIFDLVTMRAVDKWEEASRAARLRLSAGGTLAQLVSESSNTGDCTEFLVPESTKRYLRLCRV